MITVVLILLTIWVVFNLLAGWAPLLLADRISPGRLPVWAWGKGVSVRYYVGENVRSYAFNVWAPPFTAVVFDREFFTHAGPDLFRFVVAHELGHARMHHHIHRWLAVVSGLALLPSIRKRLSQQEVLADEFAERLTGFPKSMFPQLK